MAVSNEKIINKMIQELYQAKEKNETKQMHTHISNVKLLCELLLDEEDSTENTEEISQAELKAMLGDSVDHKPTIKRTTTIDHEEANGTSIFDF